MRDDKRDVGTKAKKLDQPEGAVEDAELSDEALTDVSGGFNWDRAIKRAKEDRWFPTV